MDGNPHTMRCGEGKLSATLNRCFYPSCVGRSATWALSPLALNILLAIFKNNTSYSFKYSDIHSALKQKNICKINTGIIHSPSIKTERFKKGIFGDMEIKEVDFGKSSAAESIKQWVNKCDDFKEFNIEKSIATDTALALLNYSSFKGSWLAATPGGRQMKIHNSFKYTQDVNYEPRILEFPMQDDDFRVVVFVPNEVDLLHTLYRRLTSEGLASSFASIQPVFSINSVFRAPNVAVKSETHILLEEETNGDFSNESLIQFGSVAIDKDGAHAKVLSCLYSTKSKPAIPSISSYQPEKPPYFFAITFKDVPLYTGQYVA